MSSTRDVDGIISRVYYDTEGGFTSIAKTLEKARKIDPKITRNDVKSFLDKQEHLQVKKRRTDNSWIPFGPRDQFQIDLADFGVGSDFRYAFVVIDPFTKKLLVVPLKTKSSESSASAMDIALSELDVPNSIYTDEGGEFTGPAFKSKLDSYAIQHIVTRGTAPFAERAIRTLRDGINVRLTVLRLTKKDWWRMIKQVVDQYSGTVHNYWSQAKRCCKARLDEGWGSRDDCNFAGCY